MRFPLPLAALALLWAPPAAACSPAPGARVPTNMELVDRAELILIGTVAGGTSDGGAGNRTITIHPVAALKGNPPPGDLTLDAMIAPDPESALLSNPYDLAAAHPQAMAGACNRYAFPLGTRVLFFLRRNGAGWAPTEGLFSRWAEDVLTDDAPWLKLARFYVDVQALPPAQRKAALLARRAGWGAMRDDPVAQLMALDIDRQLAGPNKPLREAFPPTETDESYTPAPPRAATAAERAAANTERAAAEAPRGD